MSTTQISRRRSEKLGNRVIMHIDHPSSYATFGNEIRPLDLDNSIRTVANRTEIIDPLADHPLQNKHLRAADIRKWVAQVGGRFVTQEDLKGATFW